MLRGELAKLDYFKVISAENALPLVAFHLNGGKAKEHGYDGGCGSWRICRVAGSGSCAFTLNAFAVQAAVLRRVYAGQAALVQNHQHLECTAVSGCLPEWRQSKGARL